MVKPWRLSASSLACAALIAACSGETPSAYCGFEESAQSGLQVAAGSGTYVYADDAAGEQVAYAMGNALVELEPGDYQARVNGTRIPIAVRAGQVTRCQIASVNVTGTTTEPWYVLDTMGTQLAYAQLGQPLHVFPGAYQLRLNDVLQPVTLAGDDTLTVAAANVNVTGTTDESYYVLSSGGEQLAYARLGQPLSMLAGTYNAKLNNAQTPFTLSAGAALEMPSGTLLGTGTTEDSDYVLDTAGSQLGYARLGSPTAWLPGNYQFRLTNGIQPFSITAGQTTEIASGTLLVSGSGTESYYILDSGGTQLGYNQLNRPTALLPGTYTIRVREQTGPVTIVAGQTTTLTR